MCIQGSIIVLEFPNDPITDLFVGSKHHYVSSYTYSTFATTKSVAGLPVNRKDHIKYNHTLIPCVQITRSCIRPQGKWQSAWWLQVAQCVVGVNQTNALGRVFASHLCRSRQTHRFRHYSVVAAGALEYPKTNSRNGNKEELYFTLFSLGVYVLTHFYHHWGCVSG